jgi:hypothetical protein
MLPERRINTEYRDALGYEVMHLLHKAGILTQESPGHVLGSLNKDEFVVIREGKPDLHISHKELTTQYGRSEHLCLEFYGEL